ncbi:MAG: phage portal protein [Galactobacter sp.]
MSAELTTRVQGLTDQEEKDFRALEATWAKVRSRNVKRSLYADGEQAFKDLGIALPPQLQKASFVLGWPQLAVRKASMRSQLEGFRGPSGDDPFDMGEILAQNRFWLSWTQAVYSAGVYGCSFITVAGGDTGAGEPAVQIMPHDAESSAALWDRRKRRIRAGLTIAKTGDKGLPAEVTYWGPASVVTLEKRRGTWTVIDRAAHQLGRPTMVPVPYQPTVRRPFGRSRISRPVMALTDMAIRAYVRMEGNAEFYSAPQLAVLGADNEVFQDMGRDQKFRLAMDRMIGLTKDEDGDVPSLTQLTQASMQPHSDMLRTIASAFAGETGIPLNSLGIIHDQPSSAEAIRAAEHDLLIDATHENKLVLGPAAAEVLTLAVMGRDRLTEPPADAWKTTSVFADPEFRSTTARADGAIKLAGAWDQLRASDVLLSQVFDQSDVKAIRAEETRAQARKDLDEMRARTLGRQQQPTTQQPDAPEPSEDG